jgi:SagB-type dehydrogenase family enzyme
MVSLIILALLLTGCFKSDNQSILVRSSPESGSSILNLPEPRFSGEMSLEEALLKRRSIREYASDPLSLSQVSQLLWAAQGITAEDGRRTAPSAGALYPLEIYLAVSNVENLLPGVYLYKPQGHKLTMIIEGDLSDDLSKAALGQSPVKNAAVNVIISAFYERTTVKYGDRGIRYVHLEVGHAAQNVCLQATALGLGVVTIGAFYDDQVKNLLKMDEKETPLYILSAGRKTS